MTTGGVLSIFSVTFALATFCPLSEQAIFTCWFAPSVETFACRGLVVLLALSAPVTVIDFRPVAKGAMLGSAQATLKATLLLFQPAALAAGEVVAVMTGGVMSSQASP